MVRKRFDVWFEVAAVLVLSLLIPQLTFALGEEELVKFKPSVGAFKLAGAQHAPPILVSKRDWAGVRRAADSFRKDIGAVSGVLPVSETDIGQHFHRAVLVGTLGRGTWIDDLAAQGKIDACSIAGKWEAGLIAVVQHPAPNIDEALVIAGSDKRGTIFALYTLSEQIGVSPWAWWADVRIPHRQALYVQPSVHLLLPPAVRYRGIFLNDEAPSLTGWAQEKFGGLNHRFYEHVFELLLRLRANYLWPAMWGSAFNEDDPLNAALADEYGIVMGTSHHEPLLRAQQEWKRHGTGEWDYERNGDVLRKFWAEGIERNKNYESTITVGMRGDGDVAMSPSSNVQLLERIVSDQRGIIAAHESPQLHNPQVWALYKEVQEYYEKGMRVPDDVTLLWSDDNWGNLRRLPTVAERARSGGAGIYYHLDYVGAPRSYKWINTVPIAKIQEQMHIAIDHGADRIWVVNVGDLKPMEFPIEFFLTMARTPARWGKDDLQHYTDAWAAREFGKKNGERIGSVLSRYMSWNARRKPEMIDPETYSLTSGDEAHRVEQGWKSLADEADHIAWELPNSMRASYFELVQYPVDASANLGLMYIAAGRNRLYARQGRVSANAWAAETRRRFHVDAELAQRYHALLHGKWNHMMDQTHIGYTFWNEPPMNAMPAVQEVDAPRRKKIGVFLQDSSPMAHELPAFDSVNRQRRTFDLALIGRLPIDVKIVTNAPWFHSSIRRLRLTGDTTVEVSVDWEHLPSLPAESSVQIVPESGPPISLRVVVRDLPANARGFIENAGVVAIDAAHADQRTEANGVVWETIPGLGFANGAMESFPTTALPTLPGVGQACLVYGFTVFSTRQRTLQTMIAPTLAFDPAHSLRYSVQLDQAEPRVVDAWGHEQEDWGRAVSNGVHRVSTPLGIVDAGVHSLHLCRVDAGVVVERISLFSQPMREYLGPEEVVRVPTLQSIGHQ